MYLTENIRSLNLIFASCSFAVSAIGLAQTLIGRFTVRKTRVFFIAFFLILNVYSLAILARQLTYINVSEGCVALSRVLFFIQGLLASVMAVLVTGFLLVQSGISRWVSNIYFRISICLWAIYVIMLVGNIFTGTIYRVDENNVYIRGPYFPILIAPTVLIMIINLTALWQYRRRLSKAQRRAFLAYSALPMAAMIIQAFAFGVHLIALSTVIAAVISFTYIVSDQAERFQINEAENARLKIDILMAQIQPHFLFNSLTGIKYLCRTNPEKAEEGISQFTEYLRHNMDSLSIDSPIPFNDELNHVRAYLSLQKLRFGDDLNIEYDLACTDFSIPTLTLQPLVENAVMYGVRKNPDGRGTIWISTKRNPDNVEVTIRDDGPGFDPNEITPDDERTHTGIRNVRERLEHVSSGQLSIVSVIGSGTSVTIILPTGGYK